MSPLDLAFLVGPLVAPLIGILVMVALVVARPTEWALWIGSQLFGLTAAASLTYWFLWGRAFDRVHTELDPSASSEVAINAAIWACAAGCMALVVTAVSAFVSTRRPRAHVHILRHRRPCVTQLIRNEAGRRAASSRIRRRGLPQRVGRDPRGHGVWPTPGRLESSPASPTSA